MNRLIYLFSIFFLLLISACNKDEPNARDQFPELLQAKITELVPDQNLCEITTVTIIEYNGKNYYHIYCGIWSCMYCQLFDEKRNTS